MTPALLALALATALSLPEVSLATRGPMLRIGVTGDTGKGADAVARGLQLAHAEKPLDAIVLTGDNFYPCGVTSETDPRWSLAAALTGIGVPVLPILGNHDYCGKADPDAQIRATGIIPNWTFPARQYAVRAGIADFALIDTTPFVARDPSPASREGEGARSADDGDEVAAAIRDTFRASAAPWRIVVGHHPVISSGWHGYFPRAEVQRMRKLIPALREMRIDLYICGHDHHTELLRGRMAYLVSGAGSAPIPPVKLRLSTLFPSEIARERISFAIVELDGRTIRVRFYDADKRPRSEWLVVSKK